MDGQIRCNFDQELFSSREDFESHILKSHLFFDQEEEKVTNSNEQFEKEAENEEWGIPAGEPLADLSRAVDSFALPENPLSDLGELTEPLLLRVTGCSHLGEVKNLDLNSRALQQFESNFSVNLDRMFNLTVLDLSENYLTSLRGVGECRNLSSLNLQYNFIESLSELKKLRKLSEINIANNKLRDISGLSSCLMLKILKINNNQVFSFENTLNILKELPKLHSLWISFNPCVSKVKDANSKLVAALWLENLDGSPVTEDMKFHAEVLVEGSSEESMKNIVGSLSDVSHVNRVQISEGTQEKELKILQEENEQLRNELIKACDLLGLVIKARKIENIPYPVEIESMIKINK